MTTVVEFVFVFGAGAIAGAIAYGLLRGPKGRTARDLCSGDVPHLLDLLRRAHGATAVCAVMPDTEPVVSDGDAAPSVAMLDRVVALAKLGMGDGRVHVVNEDETLVAVGDGQVGLSMLLEGGDDEQRAETATADLRRLLADLRVQRNRAVAFGAPRELREWMAGGAESLEGIAAEVSEAVKQTVGKPTALVFRDPVTQAASVAAVSTGADRRLLGAKVHPDTCAGRACVSDVPIVGATSHELFGSILGDRRQREEPGVALPLRDGREGVGCVVVMGSTSWLDSPIRERVAWLAANAGPRLGRSRAVESAENRALTDELTGLPNRRALDKAMHDQSITSGSLLCVDLDHFKKLNDGFGHAAGDAALKHVADVFGRALRDGDVPARIGGEEFALWLPETPQEVARDVAERVRLAVHRSELNWAGAEMRLTCSVGLASLPETVSHIDNLLAAADMALYGAKEAGRDRVEVAASQR
ncbi:MAG: GGDEF domain-containing protein [Gemmatimonadales bacterium]